VPNPIDVSKYLANPCSALTQDQATQFGASGPGKTLDIPFLSCIWHTDQSTAFGLAVNDKQSNGLNDIYRLHQTIGQYVYFQPTTIGGYPAVTDELSSSDLSSGNCEVMVAVNDKVILEANVQRSHTGDPCGSAQRLATTALQNVKAGV